MSDTSDDRERETKMNARKTNVALLIGLGILSGFAPRARADESSQKTIFTFSAPVEIPGQVLGAGTYVFKLADSDSDRDVVQVFNKDQTHLYGTFLAIPDERLRPAGKPILTFEERPTDSPEAVKAWFYPGDNYGHEFVYPKTTAVALAKANHTPVPSMPDELAENTKKSAVNMKDARIMAMRQVALKAQNPTGEESDVSEVSTAPK